MDFRLTPGPPFATKRGSQKVVLQQHRPKRNSPSAEAPPLSGPQGSLNYCIRITWGPCLTHKSQSRPPEVRTSRLKIWIFFFFLKQGPQVTPRHAEEGKLGDRRQPTGLQLAPKQLGLHSRRFWGRRLLALSFERASRAEAGPTVGPEAPDWAPGRSQPRTEPGPDDPSWTTGTLETPGPRDVTRPQPRGPRRTPSQPGLLRRAR